MNPTFQQAIDERIIKFKRQHAKKVYERKTKPERIQRVGYKIYFSIQRVLLFHNGFGIDSTRLLTH